jgi:fermentation-respiration switch protein FrsA (DUF1100 family)/alkylhydroperoxidase/carboxymuconolactone decarboxylase family protein YurZ
MNSKPIIFFLVPLLFSVNPPIKAQQNMDEQVKLSKKEVCMVPIAAFTAKGEIRQLRSALHKGLDAGLTINESKEILVQLYAYAGFPRSLNALNELMSVLEERTKKGIRDEAGPDASQLTGKMSKLQTGTANQTRLVGQPVKGPIYEFAPVIDLFLKEHLFADIFGRDNLSWKNREIVTIAALAGLGAAENQLRSHVNVGMNNGLTKAQLKEIEMTLNTTVGPAEGSALNKVMTDISTNNNAAASMAEKKSNPFTLVYDGAITENEKGKVNVNPVSYKIGDIKIVANVYTPADYDQSHTYPVIVVAHPNGGVKEQVSGLYAQRLAEQGFISITADAAYQGGSGGYPRNVDKPANRIEDIHAMADYISRFPGVDTARLGLLGICGGGGYSLKAAQSDKRFKAVATLSMFNSGEVRRNGFMNSQMATIQERLKQATDARANEVAGGEVLYAGVANPTDEEIARIPTDLYREGYQYYYRNYAHPNSTFKYTMSSLLDLMTFDAATNMDLINQPLLMIAGSKADTRYMTDEAFSKATNAKDKELYLIEGATHIQTYWKPEYVALAVIKLSGFFGSHLK